MHISHTEDNGILFEWLLYYLRDQCVKMTVRESDIPKVRESHLFSYFCFFPSKEKENTQGRLEFNSGKWAFLS